MNLDWIISIVQWAFGLLRTSNPAVAALIAGLLTFADNILQELIKLFPALASPTLVMVVAILSKFVLGLGAVGAIAAGNHITAAVHAHRTAIRNAAAAKK